MMTGKKNALNCVRYVTVNMEQKFNAIIEIFVHKNEHKVLMKLRPAFKHDEITSSSLQPVLFLVSISTQVNSLSF